MPDARKRELAGVDSDKEEGGEDGYESGVEGDWNSDDGGHVEFASPRRLRKYPRSPTDPYLPSNKTSAHIPACRPYSGERGRDWDQSSAGWVSVFCVGATCTAWWGFG
ncbi:hypothetical protein IAR50_001277 [Cryptococcus sp. DSM 104548]